ncbi:MAG: gamma-glutamyltransferase [Calditrichaeota bacterium]|nr:MAG: gamma-glutamyltransferase [Calditrichota bacterium]
MKQNPSFFTLMKNKVFFALLWGSIFLFSSISAQDVVSDSGMVASAHPLASKAGLEILNQGGNAIDAAVATAFALAVVEPNASGLGGGGFMVIKMADMKEGITISYRESAPAKTTAEFYYAEEPGFKTRTHHGPHSVGVPGVVAGLSMALEKYGTMQLKDVVKPAIKYARDGFDVSEKFSGMIIQAYDLISSNPATSKIYLVDGLPPEEGSIIKNPNLADTFVQLAKGGAGWFYKGEMAKAISEEVKILGGYLEESDLHNYKAIHKKPVHGTYHGYEIISSAPPTGGGTHLVELLNILEGYNLQEMGHNSTTYIHHLADAMKIIFADKRQNMADPEFYDVPVEKLTDKTYAKSRRALIHNDKTLNDYKSAKMVSRESGSTTHLSVIDLQDNMVALTQSINYWFGAGITVPGTGVLLNNHLADFSENPLSQNAIEPNKQPVSSIAPTLLLKDGKPFLTIGTPGGSRIIGALAQIIINVVDFGMSMDDAIEAPRVHAYGGILHVEGRIPKDTIAALEQLGHKVKVRGNFDNYFGGAQGILVDQKTGDLIGGADSRRDGVAAGY